MIDNLNKFRCKIIVKYILVFIMFLIFLLQPFIITWLESSPVFEASDYTFGGSLFGVLIFILFIMCYHVDNCRKKYAQMFRKYIGNIIFNINIENICYDSQKGISQDKIYKSKLLRNANNYKSQYYLSGKVNGMSFEQTYADMYSRYNDFDNRTYRDRVFEGKWLILYLDKLYQSNVQIIDKKFGGAINNSFIYSVFNKDIFGRKTPKYEYQKLKTSNDKFNKKFNIFINDNNGFNFPDTFFENIYELSMRTKGKLMLSIINNELHIGIQKGKNVFVPNLLTPINDQIIFETLNNEVNFINEIIEVLKDIN